jgi:hypothetical protein
MSMIQSEVAIGLSRLGPRGLLPILSREDQAVMEAHRDITHLHWELDEWWRNGDEDADLTTNPGRQWKSP